MTFLLDLSVEESLKRSMPKSNASWYIGFGRQHPSISTLDVEAYKNYLNCLREIYKELAITPKDILLNAKLTTEQMVRQILSNMSVTE